jgi:hypothetical protein
VVKSLEAVSAELATKSLHWDITKLLEFGVKEEVIVKAKPEQIKELLKGLLYLRERFPEYW